MARPLHRNPDLIVRQVDAQFFLIDEDGGTIDHLNETASAIWRFPEEPATTKKVVDTFRFFYPEEDFRNLKKSIRSLLRGLTYRKVLEKRRE